MFKDETSILARHFALLSFVAILSTTIGVFAQRDTSDADATADFEFPPPEMIMYAKAENLSGQLTAFAFDVEAIPPDRIERYIMFIESERRFEPTQGTIAARFLGQPIIDFAWQSDSQLRAFVLCTECNDEMKWLLVQRVGGVNLQYEFIKERSRVETKRSISPDPDADAGVDHNGFVVVSVERVFAEPLEKMTQVVITAEYPDSPIPSERLSVDPDIKFVLATVKGSADISFEWRGASQLIITMDGDKENDVLHMRDKFLDLEIVYEFRE